MSQTTLRVDFVSESAGYQNSFGWYNRATGIGGVLFANVEAEGRNAPLKPGQSFAEFTVDSADVGNIEYFLIPNGGDIAANTDSELSRPVKVIQLSDGTWAVATLDSNGNVQTSNGKPNILVGEGRNAFFTEKSKNEGGIDHASSTVGSNQTAATLAGDTADGATGLIAWEDLAATKKSNGSWTAPGDADYNDAVFRVSVRNERPDAKNDNVTVGEDAGATPINVLANDSDSDGDTLKVISIDDDGVMGTIAIAPGGAGIVFNPGAAYQYLGAGESKTETITYTISDGNGGTDTATVKVKIVGANDGPVVRAADLSGSVTERGDGASGENTANLTASGEITFSDPDRNDSHTVSVTPNGSGYLGTFAATVSNDDCGPGESQVDWNFKVKDNALDYLSAGQTLTQSYTVKISDGNGGIVTQTVNVTLIGTNDRPVIDSAVTTATVTELADGSANENTITHQKTGTIDFTDVDLADAHSVTVTPQGSGYRGTLTASVTNVSTGDGDGRVTWNYSVSDGALDDLAAGQTLTQTYRVTISDGQGGTVDKNVTITIKGAADGSVNIAPETIAVTATGNEDTTIAVALQGSDSDGSIASFKITALPANGTLYSDVLLTHAIALNGTVAASGNAATVYFKPAPDFNGGTAFQYAAIDNSGAQDATAATASISVAAVNDAAVLSSDIATLTETNAVLTTGGTLTIDDVDSPAIFVAQTGTPGTYGNFSINAAGVWSYTTSTPHNEFAAGATYTDVFSVASADGTLTSVTVHIVGSNDAPEVTGGVIAGSVTEDTTLAATGQLTSDDVDNSAVLTWSVDPHALSPLGDLTVDSNGAWTYNLSNGASDVQGLRQGQSVVEVYNVRVTDQRSIAPRTFHSTRMTCPAAA